MSNRAKRLLNRNASKPAVTSPAKVSEPVPVEVSPPEVQKKQARGAGKVPAGELYSVRLAPSLMVALRSRAASEARPVSEVVRLALQAYLATPSHPE